MWDRNIVLLLAIYLCLEFKTVITIEKAECRQPLGMLSGKIPDSAITASSQFAKFVGPEYGRIHTEMGGGAWCPQRLVSNDSYEYLQIDLGRPTIVTMVEVQGRFGNGQGQEFAESFRLEYNYGVDGKWKRYMPSSNSELLAGNTNTYKAEKRELTPSITCTKIRFVPYSNVSRTVCMRVEMYGCRMKLLETPKKVRAVAVSATQVEITWQSPSDDIGIIGFVLTLIDLSEGPEYYTLELPPDIESYTINGLQPDTRYRIDIYSKSLAGRSSGAQVPVKTPPAEESCRHNLGMESGEIPDEAITASSYYADTVSPIRGRIRTEKEGGAWCPKSLITYNVYEYLQIDLGHPTKVTMVEVQGRFGNGMGLEYAEKFRLEYQEEIGGEWRRYTQLGGNEILSGNINTYTTELRQLTPPIFARQIRFIPYSVKESAVCMRVELYGCKVKDPCRFRTCPEHSTCLNVQIIKDVDWFVSVCKCETGFTWNNTDQTCVDRDECAIRDVCSQICINTIGSYLCDCRPGFTLEGHGACRANGDTSWYYITSKTGVRMLHLESGYEEILVDGTSNTTALDYDLGKSLIFYTDLGQIKSAHIPQYTKEGVAETSRSLCTTNPVLIETGTDTDSPSDIAVDWLSCRVYWIDGVSGSIKSASYHGDMIKTVIDNGLDEPRNIVLHPKYGYLYWTDSGQVPYIGRLGIDSNGSKTDQIHTDRDGLKTPTGLTIDYVNDRLYWIDKDRHLIGSSNLDGSDYVIVFMDPIIIQNPISLAVFEDRLSWMEQKGNLIYSVNRRSGCDVESRHVDTGTSLTCLKVYQVQIQNTDFQAVYDRMCVEANCEQICVTSPGNNEQTAVTCQCADNFSLHQDGRSCVKHD